VAKYRPLLVALILFALGVALSVTLQQVTGRRQRETRDSTALPHRIICMAPNVTETVFALGCGDRVVGVSRFCSYPPEATRLPRVGAFVNPNVEGIIALSPDLLIIQGKHDAVAELCRQKGYPLLRVQMENLASLYREIQAIGSRLGCPDAAAKLCDEIRNGLAEVAASVAGRPRVRVFVCLGRTPGSLAGLYTPGRDTFLTEVIRIAGGENVFADVSQPYPAASKEALLKLKPDVIIEPHPGEPLTDRQRRQLLADWRQLGSLPAVQNGRVHILTDDHLLIIGPRVVLTARKLAELIHPEIKID